MCLGPSHSSSVHPCFLPLLPTHCPHHGEGQLSDVAAMSDRLPQVSPSSTRRPSQGSETLPFPVPLPTQLFWIGGNKVEVQISPLCSSIFVPMDPLPELEITQMIEQVEYVPTMERYSRTKGANRYIHKNLDSPPGKYTE